MSGMIYTTGSIVRAIVADSGEWAVGVVVRIVGDSVVVACALQVSGGRIVYSREVLGEVVEVLAGPDDPQPQGALAPPAPTIEPDESWYGAPSQGSVDLEDERDDRREDGLEGA